MNPFTQGSSTNDEQMATAAPCAPQRHASRATPEGRALAGPFSALGGRPSAAPVDPGTVEHAAYDDAPPRCRRAAGL